MEIRSSDIRHSYLREHPLALWFSIGAIVTGLPLLVAPFLADSSSALELLPPWAIFLWAASYALGGLLSLIGMVKLKPRLEAAGMTLLASALSVTVISIIAARGPGALLSVAFLLTLAIGCASRAYFLTGRATWSR